MKTAILLVLISATAILLTGCGHYGMGRHYNDGWRNQSIPGSRNMHMSPMNSQGMYMNGNSMQSEEVYMDGNSTQSQSGYGR